MSPPLARRNTALSLVYHIGQMNPFYWPYMFHFVTVVRGLDPFDFGLLKGIYYGGVFVLELPGGIVADRFSRRGTMAISAALNAVACLLYVYSTSFAHFACAELVFSLSTALMSGSGSALLYDSYATDGRPGDYPRAQGLCGTVSFVTGTLGLVVADHALVREGDPIAAYAASAGIALMAAIAALAMREPPRERGATSRQITAGALGDALRNRQIGGILLLGAGVFVWMRAANSLLFNPVLVRAGVPPDDFGVSLAGASAIGGLAAWGAARVLERVGERATWTGLIAFVASIYALLWLGLAPVIDVAAICAHGIALGALPVLVLASLNRRIQSGARRATVLSIDSLLSRGAYALASAAGGAALDTGSLPTAVAAVGAIGALTILAGTLRLARDRPPEGWSEAQSEARSGRHPSRDLPPW